MKITLAKSNGITIVEIQGEVDLESSPKLREAFVDLIKKNIYTIVLDFSGTSYIDSSGLATCVELFQQLQPVNGTVSLACVPAKIRAVFEVTRLDKLFSIYESREQAVAAL